MDSQLQLPEAYRPVRKADILGDRRQMLLVNGVEAVLFLLMTVIGILLLVGRRPLPVLELDRGHYLLWFFAVLAMIVIGQVVHIVLHGVFMRLFSGSKKIMYGIQNLYIFAGCEFYFTKGNYLVIALAPLVLCGLVLLILNLVLSPIWAPAAYILQIFNVATSGRDLVAVWGLRGTPEETLVHDTGLKVTVFTMDSGFPV